MPVAQRLPLYPVHPFESSDGEQGRYANALNAGKEEEAELMLWGKKAQQWGEVMKSALRKNPQMSYTMSSTRRPTSHIKIHMLPLYFMYIYNHFPMSGKI